MAEAKSSKGTRLIFAAALLVLAFLACDALLGEYLVWWVTYRYPGDLSFHGSHGEFFEPDLLWQLSVGKSLSGSPIPADHPLVLHWKGTACPVGQLTPSLLESWGAEIREESDGGREAYLRESLANRAATQPSVECRVTVYLDREGHPLRLDVMAGRRWEGKSPLALSLRPNSKTVSLPASDTELKAVFGKPIGVSKIHGPS